MKTNHNIFAGPLGGIVAVFIWLAAIAPMALAAADGDGLAPIQRGLASAGARGGLLVQLGGDIATILPLAQGENAFLVHAFHKDELAVSKAWTTIAGNGLSGRAAVWRLREDRLPYAENMVNALVMVGGDEVPRAELERVLVPGGAMLALDATGAVCSTWIKPWPSELDEWTHYQYDTGYNGVSKDMAVGPPKRMKWVAGPWYSRGHEYASSVNAAVTANGRLVYVIDEGQTGNYELPSRWTMIARDAFNGLMLWRRPVPAWAPLSAKGGFSTLRYGDRLAVEGDLVFAAIGKDGSLLAIDARTGQDVHAFPEVSKVQQVLVNRERLVILGENSEEAYCIAVHAIGSWRNLWLADIPQLAPMFYDHHRIGMGLRSDGERIYYQQAGDLVAIEELSGRERWRYPLGDINWKPKNWSDTARYIRSCAIFNVAQDAMHVSYGKELFVLEADTGERRWHKDDMLAYPSDSKRVGDKLVYQEWGKRILGFDMRDGTKVLEVVPEIYSSGHHPRCYPPKATERYFITTWRGAEFISWDGKEQHANDHLRGNCGYGVMPANGLLYLPPNQCFCYAGNILPGFKAMAPAAEDAATLPVALPPESPARLTKGPAYNLQPSTFILHPSDEWPMYRGGPARLGNSEAALPVEPSAAWSLDLGGRITPPVVGGGLVLTACKDTGEIVAADAATGVERWRYRTGALIDSPPTIHQGMALFGCSDGRIYCLRLADGELAWSFLAAPYERWIGAFDGVQSAWPVSGSVLILDGLVYAVAGRSTWIDGGIHLYALEPHTGKVMMHRALKDGAGREFAASSELPYIPAFHMEGARADLLVADRDGRYLFMGPLRLDRALAPKPAEYLPPETGAVAMDLKDEPYVDQEMFEYWAIKDKGAGNSIYSDQWPRGKKPMGDMQVGTMRVTATGGLLDDSLFNRTFWMYSNVWPGFHKANHSAKAGQLLVADATHTYAARRYHQGIGHSPLFLPETKGVLVFADRNDNEPVLDQRSRLADKGFGFSRATPPVWHDWVPILVTGMVVGRDRLAVAGAPDIMPSHDPYIAYEGRAGAKLLVYDKTNGRQLGEVDLPSPPVFDGLIATDDSLFLSSVDGVLRRLTDIDKKLLQLQGDCFFAPRLPGRRRAGVGGG